MQIIQIVKLNKFLKQKHAHAQDQIEDSQGNKISNHDFVDDYFKQQFYKYFPYTAKKNDDMFYHALQNYIEEVNDKKKFENLKSQIFIKKKTFYDQRFDILEELRTKSALITSTQSQAELDNLIQGCLYNYQQYDNERQKKIQQQLFMKEFEKAHNKITHQDEKKSKTQINQKSFFRGNNTTVDMSTDLNSTKFEESHIKSKEVFNFIKNVTSFVKEYKTILKENKPYFFVQKRLSRQNDQLSTSITENSRNKKGRTDTLTSLIF